MQVVPFSEMPHKFHCCANTSQFHRVLLSYSSAPGNGRPVAESETQTTVNACLSGKGNTTGEGSEQEALLTDLQCTPPAKRLVKVDVR